ncbi:MAG: Formyl-CoA transferase [Cyanobacteria bacterium RYN_339]|nr:Formyl-CoA transferase [Cyanobacteria bacterium RYN_339]
MTLPLSGLRVIDLTRALAGPYCAMMLGDLGADVIKVEQPGKGDESRGWGPPFQEGESSYFLSINRNKRSITLDLKSPEGKEALTRLIASADVLLENFSPGTMSKLGFEPKDVCARHPRLIYCSISGFGQAGPNRNLPAYDLILQGMGGLMSITGPVDGPPTKVGVPIADLTAGMFASTAIMTALFHRERTGQGQYVDTSLLDGQLALLTFQGGRYFATNEAPTWQGNEHPSIAPYETFKAKDGYVNMAVGNESLWAKFCPAFGLEACLEDPRFLKNADRLQHRPALIGLIEGAFAPFSTAEVLARLQAAGVPCGPIYDLAQALTDPHVVDQGLVREVQHPTAGTVKYPGMPYRFSASPAGVDRPPPRLGEHTAAILAELGLAPAPVPG